MIELKPCPFCGCKDIEIERVGTSRASCIVVCTECGCKLESNETGAGMLWNTRADSTELAALREQVKVLTQYLSEDGYDMLRLIATVKYLRGIAERGAGRLCDDNELVEQFVLGYVKGLEEQVKVLREALEACIDLLSNLENIGGFVGLAVISNGQTALEQTKPKDGK